MIANSFFPVDIPDDDETTTSAAPPPSAWVVRYGLDRRLDEFSCKPSLTIRRGDSVILRTGRGLEWGEVLTPADDTTRVYLAENAPAAEDEGGKIVRRVTEEDEAAAYRIREIEQTIFLGCGEMVAERKLQMQLIDVEHLFGGERVIIYYLAEKRVDFRELVRALAKAYRVRIQMRQIGVRDEARLLADYGDCGKPVCCNTHLTKMPPVSMKMAKIQKATLDPSKISGRCGRLKCCLRYEYDTYVEHQRELPPVGASVVTDIGRGRVLAQEILARKVLVEYDRTRLVMTDPDEILTVIKKSRRPKNGGKGKGKQPPAE